MIPARFTRYYLFTPAALALLLLALRFSPYPELDAFLNEPSSVRIYDRNGALLHISSLQDGMRREFVALDALPPHLVAVFVYAEDAAFYRHAGFNPLSVARAAWQNIAGGRRISGASTITMQLARMIERRAGTARRAAFGGKILELFNALRLERRLTKQNILELYLNNIPFGSQTEGVASAARNFFTSEAGALAAPEIFALAVVPRRPAANNPIEHPESCWSAARLLQRRFCADRSRRETYPPLAAIAEADWQAAAARARRFRYPADAPHLVRRALAQTKPPAADIELTIDESLNRYIEAELKEAVSRYAAQRLSTGAAVALDNRTGEILSWVGSADFYDGGAQGQVDGVLALNQPGSSMKPFLYALALERGLSPATLFADVPRDFGSEALYIPQNFNNRFNGPVLMRQALASSLNIPAVELLHRLGQKGYADFLRGLGFASLEGEGGADAAGLGLALGNAPVSILELARAFSAFPNDGRLIEPVYRKDGRASEPPPAAMSADSARIICSFLSDADSRVLAFGRARNFKADVPALFKTGTANQYQSIVALAASRRYTVAVWMGNFSGQTVIGKTGSSIPAAIARNTLNLLHSGAAHSGGREGALDFPPPEGFRMTELCAASGMGAGAACLERVHEYVAKDAPPAPPCTWHRWEDGLSTLTYPAEYQGWFLSSKRSGGVDYSDAPLSLVSPRNGFVYFFNPADAARSEIPVELTGGTDDVLEIDFDGMRLTAVRPFIFKLPANRRGLHTLTVRCGDETQEAVFRLD